MSVRLSVCPSVLAVCVYNAIFLGNYRSYKLEILHVHCLQQHKMGVRIWTPPAFFSHPRTLYLLNYASYQLFVYNKKCTLCYRTKYCGTLQSSKFKGVSCTDEKPLFLNPSPCISQSKRPTVFLYITKHLYNNIMRKIVEDYTALSLKLLAIEKKNSAFYDI